MAGILDLDTNTLLNFVKVPLPELGYWTLIVVVVGSIKHLVGVKMLKLAKQCCKTESIMATCINQMTSIQSGPMLSNTETIESTLMATKP